MAADIAAASGQWIPQVSSVRIFVYPLEERYVDNAIVVYSRFDRGQNLCRDFVVHLFAIVKAGVANLEMYGIYFMMYSGIVA